MNDRINAAIVECLDYSSESPFPPLSAATFVGRLRDDKEWSDRDVDTVEHHVQKIMLGLLVTHDGGVTADA